VVRRRSSFCAVPLVVDGAKGDDDHATVLINGFTATHAAGSPSPFEPLLYAHNRAFAFGFLRVRGRHRTSLDRAVVHLPSSFSPSGAHGRLVPPGHAHRTFDAGLVDELSFDTFARDVPVGVFRRMTLHDDGNLRAY
jgi:hypothetical protein